MTPKERLATVMNMTQAVLLNTLHGTSTNALDVYCAQLRGLAAVVETELIRRAYEEKEIVLPLKSED